MFRRFSLLFIGLLVTGYGLPVTISITHAAETQACCLCHLRNKADKFCVNAIPKENGNFHSCNTFLTDLDAGKQMSQDHPEVNDVVCENLLDATQCQTGQGGVCPAEPTPFSDLASSASSPVDDVKPAEGSIKPTVGVEIPGLTFGDVTKQGGYVRIPFLGQYIAAAYRFAVGIAVILAIVMIVYGGFRYLVGSAAGGVKRGRTIIMDALAGLIITLGAYLLLNTVNPATLNLDAIKIPFIEPVDLDQGDITESPTDVSTCNQPQFACHSPDECETLCNKDSSEWPACSPSVADPDTVKRIPNSEGIDNPGGVKVLPELLEPIKQAGIIAHRLNSKYHIVISSGYRPFKTQLDLVCEKVRKGEKAKIGKAVAFPGGSNHGQGRAIDVKLTVDGQSEPLVCSGCYDAQKSKSYEQGAKTLAKIMGDAGFVRYKKEIWHFEFGTSNGDRCTGESCPFPPY